MTRMPPWPWRLAGVLSIAATCVAALWFLAPESYPYGPDTAVNTGLNALIPAPVGAAVLLALGVLGIALFLWRRSGRGAATGAALQAVGFAVVLGDTSLFSSLGYLVGLAMPFVGIALLLALARFRPRAGVPVLLAAVAVTAVLWAAGPLGDLLALYGAYVSNTVGSLGAFLSPIAWSWGMAAAAACWCWTAIDERRRDRRGRSEWMRPPRLLRWGRAVTVVAALGAVPYGLLRLTWLTPWPMGGGHGELFVDELDATTRITGALFVLPCAASVLLVLGLICRWGEVFPAWLPIVGGSRVPVRPVVAVGGAVAAAITVSAPGMFAMPFLHGDSAVTAVLWQLVFPFALWGPALAAAVFAYWLRRTAPGGTAAAPPLASSLMDGPAASVGPRAPGRLARPAVRRAAG